MLCMVLGVGFDEVALLALCLTDVGSAKAAGGGRPWVVKVNWVNSPVRKVHWGSTPAEYRKTMKNQNGKEWILWIQFMRCKQNATNFIYFIQTHCYLFTKCILYLYCKSRQSYISVSARMLVQMWQSYPCRVSFVGKMMRKWLKNVSRFKKWNFGFSPRPQAHVFHQVFPKQHRFLITSCEQHIASKCDTDQLRMLL